jgi:hypothetical protein
MKSPQQAFGSSTDTIINHAVEAYRSLSKQEHISTTITDDGSLDITLPGGASVRINILLDADTWFLVPTTNILDMNNRDPEAVLEHLKPFFDHLDNDGRLKPLKAILDAKDLTDSFYPALSHAIAAKPYIHEMKYESFVYGESELYVSPGPSWYRSAGFDSSVGLADFYAGYVSIPVGPLGVMDALTLVSETMIEDSNTASGFASSPGVESGSILQGETDETKVVRRFLLDENLLPPADLSGKCKGIHVITHGITMNKDVEYPLSHFIGYDPHPLYRQMRCWLPRDAKWPLPGEFVGVLAKPLAFYPWWFQESYPYLHAGNWFETKYYTTGIVREIYPPEDDDVGNVYKVETKGETVYFKPTDFYQYGVGERVAVIKTSAMEMPGGFDWSGLRFFTRLGADAIEQAEIDRQNTEVDPRKLAQKNYLIAPISFYQTVSSLEDEEGE